jgi:hypothetical protein
LSGWRPKPGRGTRTARRRWRTSLAIRIATERTWENIVQRARAGADIQRNASGSDFLSNRIREVLQLLAIAGFQITFEAPVEGKRKHGRHRQR